MTSLHNELAVTHSNDKRIRGRLLQLEANNAAARTVINTTPPPIETKTQP